MLLLSAELSNAFVVFLGIGVVFVGLVCLILICYAMGAICKKLITDKKTAVAPVAAVKPVETIPNRKEFVAAVAAAIAEDMGTDVSRIRIHSIKKL